MHRFDGTNDMEVPRVDADEFRTLDAEIARASQAWAWLYPEEYGDCATCGARAWDKCLNQVAAKRRYNSGHRIAENGTPHKGRPVTFAWPD